MKTMLFSFICLVALTTHSKAQTSFGIQGGATFANQKYSGEGFDLNLDTKVGLSFGLVGVMPISKNFAFRPELNFTQKGAKSSSDDGMDGSINLNYIELPLNFVYRMNNDNCGLFIGAGPSVAFGISGKSKSDEYEDEKVKFGNGDDADLKALDLGGNIIAGFQFKNGVFLSANYNLGLNNFIPGEDIDDIKGTNNYFGFKIGFMFK
ncbi:MAG: porin family protein [Bacteroidota bacterium]